MIFFIQNSDDWIFLVCNLNLISTICDKFAFDHNINSYIMIRIETLRRLILHILIWHEDSKFRYLNWLSLIYNHTSQWLGGPWPYLVKHFLCSLLQCRNLFLGNTRRLFVIEFWLWDRGQIQLCQLRRKDARILEGGVED